MADYNSIKLGGLFKTKRQGMWVGNIKPDELEELQALLNSKKVQRHGMVIFMFKNTRPDGPIFNLLADAAKPREEFTGKKKRILEEEGEEAQEGEEEEVEDVEEEEDEPAPKPKKKAKVVEEDDQDDF